MPRCNSVKRIAIGLLLVPRLDERQRQIVDTAAKGVGEGASNLQGRIGIIALPNVEETRQTADLTEVQLVEAELAAGECQNKAIFRHGLRKFGVVIASGPRTIAAAH